MNHSLARRTRKWLGTFYSVHIARYILRNVRQEVFARLHLKKAAGGAYSSLDSPQKAAERAFRIAREFHERVSDQYDGPLDRVIEIGPGDSLAVLIAWIGFGAKSAIGIDAYGDPRDLRREKLIVESVLELLGPTERARVLSIVDLSGKEFAADESRLRYIGHIRAEHLDRVEAARNANLIFSNAVFEHVSNPEKALVAMHRSLAPDGVMLHKVDLRNHGVLAEFGTRAFLRPSNLIWHLMGSANGSFPNRKGMEVYAQTLRDCRAHFSIEPTFKPEDSEQELPAANPEPNGFWLMAAREKTEAAPSCASS